MNAIPIYFRIPVLLVGLLCIWQGIYLFLGIPSYLLPSPISVFIAFKDNQLLLWSAALTTFNETIIGLILGCGLGMILALMMSLVPFIRQWLMPVILISQSIPTFALAPLLVLWFGFGISSKIVMAMIMIFFPVTSAFFDGLSRTPPEWIELGKTMNSSPLRQLLFIRIPAALPSFASGLRIAAAIAPIGAVVGEWVGASSGLGFLMQNANSRFQTDLMFAALFILSMMTICLWGMVAIGTKKLIPWAENTKDL
ncbi:ABC transporter permease [Commensalibacter papalotli (ex Botero et al. 2024)]|uniref:Permease component (TauC) n=1 Tax=Commensalibacter papalotli (ex Botero et al. 2024) TaxID=2972766 RepID=A0ABM9HP51_9PROT|nr:ABC transporter permease [Commensalibacter papalotli (ex Botero et al. 2024)]CAI3941918.1 ABC-type nitrate/sulfonate/bicarbonate transport system [Commensalibacter papalotli (ex Botero et al. 2024)]